MIKFTIVKNKVVLDPNIVLFKEFDELYKLSVGPKLLQIIYYTHSRDGDNPFRDLDIRIKAENILRVVFNKNKWADLKLSSAINKKFDNAEKLFKKLNDTSESRLSRSIDKKLDEIATLLDDTTPTIEESITKSGETKFNTNLNIIINLFSKIEAIMKSRSILQNAILKKESSGRTKGGGTTSFREMGLLNE